MGYVPPSAPGEPENPWIMRLLSLQIAIWLIATPFLAVGLVFVCDALAF